MNILTWLRTRSFLLTSHTNWTNFSVWIIMRVYYRILFSKCSMADGRMSSDNAFRKWREPIWVAMRVSLFFFVEFFCVYGTYTNIYDANTLRLWLLSLSYLCDVFHFTLDATKKLWTLFFFPLSVHHRCHVRFVYIYIHTLSTYAYIIMLPLNNINDDSNLNGQSVWKW